MFCIALPPLPEPHLVLGKLRQQVQRADGQPELTAVRELADACAQGNKLVAGHLQVKQAAADQAAATLQACPHLAALRSKGRQGLTLVARRMMSSRT